VRSLMAWRRALLQPALALFLHEVLWCVRPIAQWVSEWRVWEGRMRLPPELPPSATATAVLASARYFDP
jgi:hypothetical protein